MQNLTNLLKTSKRGKKIGILTLLLICSICLVCRVIFGQDNSTQVAQEVSEETKPTQINTLEATATPTFTPVPPTNTPESTATPKPSNTPEPIATLSPTDTPEIVDIPLEGILPGLKPPDITINLEDRQFTCTNAETGELYYTWTCKLNKGGYDFTVVTYSKSLGTVDLIETVALSFEPDDNLVAPVMGFIATMPYDGAEPEKARTWVEETLPTITESGDVKTATFGGVEYQLYGPPTARTLEIGTLLP